MKVHLHQKPGDELDGYLNVCIGTADNRSEELDNAVDDAEATELIMDNVLEYVPLTELLTFLTHVITKLRHGGTLIVTGTDAYAVAKDFVHYRLTIEDFNILLNGPQADASQVKTAILTLHGMVRFLREEFKLEIIRHSLDEYDYVIEAKRP